MRLAQIPQAVTGLDTGGGHQRTYTNSMRMKTQNVKRILRGPFDEGMKTALITPSSIDIGNVARLMK